MHSDCRSCIRQTLTQIPQGIDGLWFGRPGSILPPRGCFLSGAQHICKKLRFMSLCLPHSLYLPCSGIARCLSAGTSERLADELHGAPAGGQWERLRGLGAPQAAPHGFYPGGGKQAPVQAFSLLMSLRLDLETRSCGQSVNNTRRWLPGVTFKIRVAESRLNVTLLPRAHLRVGLDFYQKSLNRVVMQ